MRRIRRQVGERGASLAVEETHWGVPADAPAILAVHATGMCKEVLRPLIGELSKLRANGRVIAVDQPAHGDSDTPEPPFDWWDVGRQIAQLAPPGEQPVGFGHSSGAAELVLAELNAPGTFSSLVLVEPIIFPPAPAGTLERPLVKSALRRKQSFPSADAALENFARKPAFSGWTHEALAAYVQHGLVPGRDGVTLKCPPHAEAEFYRGAARHGAWERLGEIRCPVRLVAGEHSDTHSVDFLRLQAAQFAESPPLAVIPGAAHFVVMERPDLVAAELARALEP